MDDRFFKQPILNNPYEYPSRHWELDEQGQPTQRIEEYRRSAQFITPIPKPKKRRGSAKQIEMVLDEGEGLSTEDQRYDLSSTINTIRDFVNPWRMATNPNDWKVTPETARRPEIRCSPKADKRMEPSPASAPRASASRGSSAAPLGW
jgi:type III restriction enzyme